MPRSEAETQLPPEPIEVTTGDEENTLPQEPEAEEPENPLPPEAPPMTNEPEEHLPTEVQAVQNPEDAPPPEPNTAEPEPLDEREELLVALVKAAMVIGYKVGWRDHDGRDVLCIDSPAGPVGFHVRRRRETFGDLPGFGPYDGADDETRSSRLQRMWSR